MTVLCYTAIVVGRERKWVCITYVRSLGDIVCERVMGKKNPRLTPNSWRRCLVPFTKDGEYRRASMR